MQRIWDVLVIGGGPAGLMAAWSAKHHNPACRVLVCERQERFGGKLWVSGGGRCNLSHSASVEELLEHYRPQPKFLYPALRTFGDSEIRAWFETRGLKLTREGDRWYPRSQQASSVVHTLLRACRELGIRLQPHCPISSLRPVETTTQWIAETASGDRILTRNCILACGNPAFSSVSAADAFSLAQSLSLELSPRYSALCALEVLGEDRALCQKLTGVRVSVQATVWSSSRKCLDQRTGDLLFTHRGLTGPVALDLSRCFGPHIPASLQINFCPGHSAETLANTLRMAGEAHPQNGWIRLVQSIEPTLPKRLLQTLFSHKLNLQVSCTKSETTYTELASTLTQWRFEAVQPVPSSKAMQLIGGLRCQDLQPRTMQVKAYEGLYAIGDQLELAGDCGGFNLLIAWSTGFLAGRAAGQKA